MLKILREKKQVHHRLWMMKKNRKTNEKRENIREKERDVACSGELGAFTFYVRKIL